MVDCVTIYTFITKTVKTKISQPKKALRSFTKFCFKKISLIHIGITNHEVYSVTVANYITYYQPVILFCSCFGNSSNFILQLFRQNSRAKFGDSTMVLV